MKKLLCLILLISMSVTVFSAFSVTADAAMAPKDAMDGYENLVLAYTHNSNRADYGRFAPDDFKPYVLYLDKNGKAQDYFFDSYLFLPCMSYGPSSARMHYDKANPTKAIDWTFYVEDTFYIAKESNFSSSISPILPYGINFSLFLSPIASAKASLTPPSIMSSRVW